MKKKIVILLRRIYKMIPLKNSTKQKIKNKLVSHISIIKKIQKYNDCNFNPKPINNNCIPFEITDFDMHKKIAVHLHLFYIDLSKEFISYFNNIPYKFDLFISISDNSKISQVKQQFSKIKNVQNVVVRVAENYGRDFGPMFVLFKNELLKYDYFLHVHSKKSLRTGNQQDGWRKYMLDCLLKDEYTVKQIFFQFEHGNNIGLIYPETYVDMPYWAHTWLYNRSNCDKIANKLGIKLDDEYIDYSVGSFFWIKSSAIKPFLDLNFKKNDFGSEEGKADGTLAHAIERMIPQAIKKNNYNYLVVDIDHNCFRTSGLKNMFQYNNQNMENIYNNLKNYDFISFDIFDTLITRKVYIPQNILEILEKFVKSKYDIENFSKIRNDAEYNVRVQKNFLNDCNIDEIYMNIQEITSLSKKQCEIIKAKEIELEIDFAAPRKEILELFNKLKKDKKKIVLISDMYLTSEIITKMLNKCGYSGWYKLLVSSEVGLRKDNATIWPYYFDEIVKDKSSIHVGDNEHSDIQILCDMAKPFIHVMQSKKMFGLTNYSTFIKAPITCKTLGDKLALGLIVNNRIFNDPFKFNGCTNVINSYKDLGYVIFGPLFTKFFEYLNKECEKNKTDELLFLAREGYYLQPLYKKYCKIANQKEVPNKYFLTSRRSTSVSCIKNIEDVEEIMKSGYEGSLKNLYKTRLGLDIDVTDKFIKLDDCRNEVLKNISDNFSTYKIKFAEEKESYINYCKKEIKGKKSAVVDLGYSGTIQYYLMKLLNKKIDGFYFILTDNIKPLKIDGKASCCFNFKSDTLEKNIYNFSMILEAFLTAPVGQLIKFDKSGNPIYKDEEINEEFIKKLDDISKGIVEFYEDYLGLAIKYNLNLSNEFIGTNLSSLIYTDVLNKNIKNDFKLENSYSLDSTINVFDYLNLVYVNNKK